MNVACAEDVYDLLLMKLLDQRETAVVVENDKPAYSL